MLLEPRRKKLAELMTPHEGGVCAQELKHVHSEMRQSAMHASCCLHAHSLAASDVTFG